MNSPGPGAWPREWGLNDDVVEYYGGPWDGRRDALSTVMRTPVRHMPGRADGQPAELVTYVLSGRYYIYRPDRADSREDT